MATRKTIRIKIERRGGTLVLVALIGLLLMAGAAGVAKLAADQTFQRSRYEVYKDEFAAAEFALNKAFSQVQFLRDFGAPDLLAAIDAITPPTVEGYTFPKFDITQTFDGNNTYTSGRWTGFTFYTIRFRIDVTALKQGGTANRFKHPGVSLSQNFTLTYVPLFIFAIFYDPMMEIAPGPFMQVNGLVHANSDAYFESQNGLDFMKNVTVAGKIFHGRFAGSGQTTSNGDVRFNNNGTLRSMKRGDTDGWLTHTDADWSVAAQDAWHGGLKDQAQGVQKLSLPIPNDVDAHTIIERADAADGYSVKEQKFENKAGLKIIVDNKGIAHGYNSSGTEVPLTYKDPKNSKNTKSIISATTFYDAREGKTVSSLDLNIGNMIESGIVPANGILYVSSNQKNVTSAVRLTNGATIPAPGSSTGLTVATDGPLYVKGDYNTTNKKMAMVAADALTILSNAWNDANSNNYDNRSASVTTVNAVCMQGIVQSGNNNYSGGVENYFRFLEKWDGRDFTFNGSIINMWESQKATGKWKYGSPCYTAPTRKWAWDTSLGGVNGPPGAPPVVELTRSAWGTTGGGCGG